MKTLLFFSFFCTSVFAYSTLDCSNNKQLVYSSHNLVGGAHPFPGMITHIEEIKKAEVVQYRQVMRYDCHGRPCEPQRPELDDIIPENFNFSFNQDSKKVLASEGDESSPVFKETFVILFNLQETSEWMLCDYERLLLP